MSTAPDLPRKPITYLPPSQAAIDAHQSALALEAETKARREAEAKRQEKWRAADAKRDAERLAAMTPREREMEMKRRAELHAEFRPATRRDYQFAYGSWCREAPGQWLLRWRSG